MPCHHPCATWGSSRTPLMCASGISSRLLSDHSLSSPSTSNTAVPPATVTSTIARHLVRFRRRSGRPPRSGDGLEAPRVVQLRLHLQPVEQQIGDELPQFPLGRALAVAQLEEGLH